LKREKQQLYMLRGRERKRKRERERDRERTEVKQATVVPFFSAAIKGDENERSGCNFSLAQTPRAAELPPQAKGERSRVAKRKS
jgi:hypothetical protein